MKPTVQQLWIQYAQLQQPSVKEQLIEAYAPLVKYVLDRFLMMVPRSVDSNDLRSAAIIGLLGAIESFDPKRGTKFETFALPRIRGAVLDEMRTMDWAPRSLRRKGRIIEQAMGCLESSLGRIPTDEEVAEYLEVDLDAYREMLRDVNALSFVSLNDPLGNGEEGEGSLEEVYADPNVVDPLEEIEEEDTRAQLARAIEQLPERKRLVIALYYYEELTLKEIGEVLGVTESRVCQMHSEAVLFLRSRLNRTRQFELAGLFR